MKENLLKNNSTNRESQIVRVSIVSIVNNLIFAILKVIIGNISGSISILTDAINNITDSASAIITIVGTKLSQKSPDAKHPFGYGRIEYLTSLIIGILVTISGIEMIISSIKAITNPSSVDYSMVTIIVLIITILGKYSLANYTLKMGKKLDSGALQASGAEAKADVLVSIIALISAAIYIFFKFSIDAYAGVIIALFIVKAGIEVLLDTLNKILGEKIDSNLASEIKSAVEKHDIVLGAHDLIINNYGPNSNIGSINVEIDHEKIIGEVYPSLHEIQVEIYKKFHVYLVFGIYAVNFDHENSKKAWKILMDYKENNPDIMDCHGLIVDDKNKEIYCDIVLGFDCDRIKIKEQVEELLSSNFSGYKPIITIDSKFA